MESATTIRYEVRLTPGAQHRWMSKDLQPAGGENLEYFLTVYRTMLHLGLGKPLEMEMGYDSASHQLWDVDHKHRLFTPPRRMPRRRPQGEKAMLVTIAKERGLQTIDHPVGGPCYQVLLRGGDFTISAWILQDQHLVSAEAAAAFWSFLVPALDPAAVLKALPMEVHLRTSMDVLSVIATHVQTGAKAPSDFGAPDGYKEGSDVQWMLPEDEQRANSPSRKGSTGATTRRALLGDGRTVAGRTRVEIPEGMTVPYQPPAHFAWFTQPALLAQIQGTLNRVARTQGSWFIRRGVLDVSWWENMMWHVNPDQPNPRGAQREFIMELARIVPVAVRVATGERLSGVTSDFVADYWTLRDELRLAIENSASGPREYLTARSDDVHAAVLGCRDGIRAYIENNIGNSVNAETQKEIEDTLTTYVGIYVLTCSSRLKRALVYFFGLPDVVRDTSLLSEEQTARIEHDMLTDLTKMFHIGGNPPAQTVSGPPDSEFLSEELNRVLKTELAVVGIEDIEGEVSLNHSDLLSGLSFYSTGIRATVTVPQVYIDFYFWSIPALNWRVAALALLTGGLTAAKLTHAGWGYANLDDARLVFDLRPEQANEPGQVRTNASFKPTQSSADSSAWLLSINQNLPGLVAAVATPLASLCDKYSAWLFGKVAEAIGKVRLGGLWPSELWNASGGPAAVTVAGTSLNCWQGALATANELPPRALYPQALARQRDVPSTCFLCTESYLTAWIRERLAGMAAVASLTIPRGNDRGPIDEAVWESTFQGLNLPDPANLPDPSLPQLRREEDIRNLEAYHAGMARARSSGNPLAPLSCRPPARAPTAYVYRTVAERSLPQIRFPVEGNVPEAGELRLSYEVRLEAVRVSQHWHLAGVSNARCRAVPEDLFDFPIPGGFEGPPMPLGNVSPSISPTIELAGSSTRPAAGPVAGPGGPHGAERGRASAPAQRPGPEPLAQPAATRWFGVPAAGGLMMYCANPTCSWVEIWQEQVLKTYVRARVDLTAKVYMGFQQLGAIWPPEIAIEVSLTGMAAYADTQRAQLEAPVAALGIDAVLTKLKEWSLDDARQLLTPVAQEVIPRLPAYGPADMLLSAFVTVFVEQDTTDELTGVDRANLANVLLQLFSVDQSPLPPAFSTPSGFRYIVDRGVLYWPMDLAEQSQKIFDS